MHRLRHTVLCSILGCGIILGGTNVSLAEPRHAGFDDHTRAFGFKHHREGGPLRQMLRALDLTDSQRDSIRELFKTEGKDIRQQMRAQMSALWTLDPAASDYDTQVDQLAATASEQIQRMAALKSQVFALLDEEQQAKMQALMANQRERQQLLHSE